MNNEEIIKQINETLKHLYEIDTLRKSEHFKHLHSAIVILEYIKEKIGV